MPPNPQSVAILNALQQRGQSPGQAASGLININLGRRDVGGGGFWDWLTNNLNPGLGADTFAGIGTKAYQPPITKAGSTLNNFIKNHLSLNPNLNNTLLRDFGTKNYHGGLTDLGSSLGSLLSLGLIDKFIKGRTTNPNAGKATPAGGAPTDAHPGKQNTPASDTGFNIPELGGAYPDWGTFDPGGQDTSWTPPELVRRDFSQEARDKVTAAFAPLFADLERQKGAISQRGDTNRQLVGGLYDKYVQSIGNDAAQTQQRYDTQEAQRAQQGTDLANSVGGYYQSANQNTADLLKAIGGQQAAPELLQQGANEQAAQQAQVGQGTQGMQDYYGMQENSAANQATAYQDAARNEGVRGQANVLADTSAQLGGVNSQEAQQQASNAALALQMAGQLSDSDFQAQQANAGLSLQGAQMGQQNRQAQMDAAWRAYQAATGNYDASRQNQLDQWKMNMDAANFGLDKAKVQGQAGAAPVAPTGPYSAATQMSQNIGNQATTDVVQLIQRVTSGSGVGRDNPQLMGNAYNSAMQQAQIIAEKNGLPVSAVQTAIDQYWSTNFGK